MSGELECLCVGAVCLIVYVFCLIVCVCAGGLACVCVCLSVCLSVCMRAPVHVGVCVYILNSSPCPFQGSLFSIHINVV